MVLPVLVVLRHSSLLDREDCPSSSDVVCDGHQAYPNFGPLAAIQMQGLQLLEVVKQENHVIFVEHIAAAVVEAVPLVVVAAAVAAVPLVVITVVVGGLQVVSLVTPLVAAVGLMLVAVVRAMTLIVLLTAGLVELMVVHYWFF